MAAMAILNMIWQCNTISFANKFKLYKSLVTSFLLYGCETWTLLADSVTKDPGFRNQAHEETSPYLLLGARDNERVRNKIDFQVGPQEHRLETCMVRACHTPRQPLQNHPSGHPGGWMTPWSEEGMLDGQHQRLDIPALVRTAHKGLLQNRLEEDLC